MMLRLFFSINYEINYLLLYYKNENLIFWSKLVHKKRWREPEIRIVYICTVVKNTVQPAVPIQPDFGLRVKSPERALLYHENDTDKIETIIILLDPRNRTFIQLYLPQKID